MVPLAALASCSMGREPALGHGPVSGCEQVLDCGPVWESASEPVSTGAGDQLQARMHQLQMDGQGPAAKPQEVEAGPMEALEMLEAEVECSSVQVWQSVPHETAQIPEHARQGVQGWRRERSHAAAGELDARWSFVVRWVEQQHFVPDGDGQQAELPSSARTCHRSWARASPPARMPPCPSAQVAADSAQAHAEVQPRPCGLRVVQAKSQHRRKKLRPTILH